MSTAKLSRGKSCTLCQQRKVRCDLNKPCSNCAKAGVECHVAPLQPPRRRKRKVDEDTVLDRLKRAESLLSQHGLQVNRSVEDETREDDEADEDDVDELPHKSRSVDPSHLTTAENIPSRPAHESHSSPKWFPYPKQYKNGISLVRGESPDTEQEQSLLFRSFTTSNVLDMSRQFPFVVIGETTAISVVDQHPNAVQIFQLWQTYLNNVDPILKLTHTPTLQKQIISASANISKVSKPLETLMFNIYLIAVTSLSADEVQETFGEAKPELLRHFHSAAQQSLINAGFMSSSDLMVLQAHFLYLICIREFVDPRPHFCLIGIAVRVAQRIGLHRDGARFGLPPLEVEQRRRLWWNLLALDKRIAELSGSAISACSTSDADCKRPLNINDSNLHVYQKVPPSPSESLTEMVFALARFELVNAPGSDGTHSQSSKDRSNRSTPSASHMQLPRVLTHLQDYSRHIENTYLRPCDPNIPLQLFTQMTIRQSICKLHILSNVHRLATKPATIPREDRLWLLTEAITMIEADNAIQASPGCRGFFWYSQLHSPFPAYMIFAHELRDASTSPEICGRAWKAIDENHRHRGLVRALQPPIHVGFTNLFLDAWTAWEQASVSTPGSRRADRGNRESVRTPEMIVQLRGLLAAYHGGIATAAEASTSTTYSDSNTATATKTQLSQQQQQQQQQPYQRLPHSAPQQSHHNNPQNALSSPHPISIAPPPMTPSSSNPIPPISPFLPANSMPSTADWDPTTAQMLMTSPEDAFGAATALDWAAFFPQQFLFDEQYLGQY